MNVSSNNILLEQQIRNMSDDEAKHWMRFSINKLLLREYWLNTYPEILPLNNGEILYCVKTGISPICNNGQHKKFKQFPQGYYTSCAAIECKCFHNMRSLLSIESNAKIDKVSRTQKCKDTMISRHGVDNAFKMADHQQKTDETLNKKYGVTRLIDVPGVREQKQATSEKNWGTSHPRQSSIIQDKTKETNLIRFGNTNPLHADSIKDKVAATLISKYGVDNYFKSPQYQQQIRDNRVVQFGYENPGQRLLTPETLAILQSEELFAAYIKDCSYEAAAIKVKTSAFTIASYAAKYDLVGTMKIGTGSVQQDELFDWLVSLGITCIRNIRTIIPPKEIDIFLPDFNIGIEFNGMYWHTEISGGKGKNYHRGKYLACAAQGVNLIQICSSHYRKNPELIRSLIMSKLGMLTTIMGRKCDIRIVSYQDAMAFLNQNHLQSSGTTGSIRLGLYHKDELVQLLTFGLIRNGKVDRGAGNWELIRMSSKQGLTVTGGISKLFKYFVKTFAPEKIISYSDLRYFTGNSLRKLGFNKEKETDSGYGYTDTYHRVFHRLQFTKKKLVNLGNDPALTEWEIMQANGYDRIWDCGNAVWKWTS